MQGVIASSVYQNLPTLGYLVLQKFTIDIQSTAWTPGYLKRVVMDVYPRLFEISSLCHSEHCADTNMFPIPPIIRFT